MHHAAQGKLLYGEMQKMVLHSAMPVGSGEIAMTLDCLYILLFLLADWFTVGLLSRVTEKHSPYCPGFEFESQQCHSHLWPGHRAKLTIIS